MSAVMEAPFALALTGMLDACPTCGNDSPAVWFRECEKCVVCESERVRARVMAEDCDRAAHEIALNSALMQIRMMAVTTHDGWIDPTFALAVSGPESDALAACIYYLTLRGLTRKHPEHDGVFKLVARPAGTQARPS